MKKKLFISSLVLLAVCFTACKKKSPQQAEAEKIVGEWMGKTILLPEDVHCSYPVQDSLISSRFTDRPFKILLYTDSAGCTSCKLRLIDWADIIQEADTAFPGKVDFLFYFQPKNVKEMTFLFRRDRFEHPVFLDVHNKINKLNNFPANSNYQCFLLDHNNKVLSIGNPSFNPNIWKLYKQIISGETGAEAERKDKNTIVSIEVPEIQLEHLAVGEKTSAVFVLKNAGDNPLIIYDIKSTCGCTVPGWERYPAAPGKTTEITVEVTPEENGYFRKTIQVYCNIEEKMIPLTIKGTVK